MYFWLISLFGLQVLLAIPHNIEIDSQLFFHGTKVGSPRIQAHLGRKSVILMKKNGQEYNIDITPELSKTDSKVLVNYSLKIRGPLEETISRGVVALNENKQGRIFLDKGKIQLFLSLR